jgi:hypothetical protein
MATILQLATHAGVTAENVLRVVNGEPVSREVAARVNRAIAVLGPPPLPANGASPLAANGAPPLPAKPAEVVDVESAVEVARRELLATINEATTELEARLPQGVSSVVYEAVRVEVRPVAEHVAEMERLFQHLIRRIHEVEARERSERLEDIALLTELITSGWRSVDQRLGRVERMLDQLRALQNGAARPEPRHIDVPRTPERD